LLTFYFNVTFVPSLGTKEKHSPVTGAFQTAGTNKILRLPVAKKNYVEHKKEKEQTKTLRTKTKQTLNIKDQTYN